MVVLVSGGFDPLHYGHIMMFKEASKHGKLIVALNSDEWLIRKKGFNFFGEEEREAIIRSLECVDEVIYFNDDDGTCIDALNKVKPDYFFNGGDRGSENTPESVYCEENNIMIVYGMGGDNKYNSSSEVKKREKVSRKWGEYISLFRDDITNIKRLYVDKGKGISNQRHFKRSEYWIIEKGEIEIEIDNNMKVYKEGDLVVINIGQWHKCIALSYSVILEVQKGDNISEDDIERK